MTPAAILWLLAGLAAGLAIGLLGPFGPAARSRHAAPPGRGNDAEGLAAALDQAGDPVVVTDTEGAIRYVNAAFERITGYGREEVLGKNPRILNSGRQDEAFYEGLRDTLARGDTWRGVFRNRRKDGAVTEEDMTISPVRDRKGRVVRHIAVMRDITERRRREERERRAYRMEAVARLAGGIAHDFNNLLTAIIGYADLLSAQASPGSPALRHAEEIKRAGVRAATLTRQLLAFSRQQVLHPKEIELNDALEGMEPALRKALGEKIELSIARTEGLARVKADPAQLEQAVVTLALRAARAMSDGGKVSVETANVDLDESYSRRHPFVRPGPYVMLAVSDTGPGIRAEEQARLFEPFSGDVLSGDGLSLSSVYGIVKQSDGYIWASSEQGRGTTFRVYLPRVEPAAAPPAPVAAERLSGTETVLVVEDEPVVLDLVREVLTGRGYTVLSATNGEEGLAILSSHPGPIDLMVSDVVMPVMGGADLAERAARLRPQLRVLFMSGYAEHTVIRHGVVSRNSGFLQKPFTSEAAARKVREVLDAPRAS